MGHRSPESYLKKSISELIKRKEKLINLEKKAKKKWDKLNKICLDKQEEILNLKRLGTKKNAKLLQWIRNWKVVSDKLTMARDMAREELKWTEAQLAEYKHELKRVVEQQEAERKREDDLVKIIFSLNDDITTATLNMNSILTERLYGRLIKADNTLHSQVSIYSADRLRKVVALVNSITIILPEQAEEAMNLINSFFSSYELRVIKMNDLTQSLFELTRKLLVEKKRFKIGPDLYRFLDLDIDAGKFPELKKAQKLLSSSLRSEKTNSYIRLYKRSSPSSNWIPLKRS